MLGVEAKFTTPTIHAIPQEILPPPSGGEAVPPSAEADSATKIPADGMPTDIIKSPVPMSNVKIPYKSLGVTVERIKELYHDGIMSNTQARNNVLASMGKYILREYKEIQNDAIKCRYCGEFLEQSQTSKQLNKASEVTQEKKEDNKQAEIDKPKEENKELKENDADNKRNKLLEEQNEILKKQLNIEKGREGRKKGRDQWFA